MTRPRRAWRSTSTSTLRWTGGTFASAETPSGHPLVGLTRSAVAAERGTARLAGVPWGADLRLFRARGIPAVMVGTPGIERAHAVDERVRVDDLDALARILVRIVDGWAGRAGRPRSGGR